MTPEKIRHKSVETNWRLVSGSRYGFPDLCVVLIHSIASKISQLEGRVSTEGVK